MVTGQGMCVYDYWTTGQGMSVCGYWTRDACLRLPGKGGLCMFTGQAGERMSVIIGNGVCVYGK
jgi:hypothetical protein